MNFPLNLSEFLEHRARRNREKVFLYSGDEQLSYEGFYREANRAAHALLRAGVKKGDRVCLMLSNRPEFLYLWFGLAKIGGVLVPINTAFKEREAAYVINHSEATTVVTESAFAKVLAGVQPECPAAQRWIGLDVQPGDTHTDEGFLPLSEILKSAGEDEPGTKVSESDLLSIMYTSGTTGPPKGAMHSHKTYVLAGWAFTKRLALTPEDRIMAFMPLFHINAQIYSAMGGLASEASLILLPRFSLSRFWEDARRHRATKFNCPIAAAYLLAKQPPGDRDRDHFLKMVFMGPLKEDLAKTFEDRFGILPIDGYGMTECPNICQNPHDGLRKIGSMGVPATFPDPSLPLTEMKIVDEEDREVPAGAVGEVVVRSPLLMMGYYNDPDRTAEAMRGGWFHTGDNAHRDADGYYYFVDRKKDIIRRRGENISSAEVESVLLSHPDVAEAAVIPVPSELGEEEVKACIVPKAGVALRPESVVEWCDARLARFKVPRYIELRDSLPKTPTQKVEKYILRRERTGPSETCWDRERAQR